MIQFVNYMDVTYLPVYVPSEEEKKDPFLYAENVRRKMSKQVNIPCTNHSFEDMILLQVAHKKKFPTNAVNTEYNSIKNAMHDVDLPKAKVLLQKFIEYDKDGSGKVGAAEFCKALGLPFNDFSIQLFQLFDVDQDGEIDFREFISGMALLSSKNNASVSTTIKFCFEMMDEDKNGYISKEEFRKIFLKSSRGQSTKDIDEIYDEIDVKKNEKVDYDSFIEYLSENPERVPVFKALAKAIEEDKNLSKVDLRSVMTKSETNVKELMKIKMNN